VRVVRLVGDVVDADLLDAAHAVGVVEEAAPDVVAEVRHDGGSGILSATPPQPRFSSHTVSARSKM